MNELLTISQDSGTVSTIQLRKMINEARVAFGEPKVRNDQLLARIEDELDGELGVCKSIAHPQSGVQMCYYDLTLEQCMLVGMRESKAVRRNVLDKLNELQAQQRPALPDFTNPAEAARSWANEYEQRVIAEKQLELAKPKIDFYDQVTGSKDAIAIGEAAKVLNFAGLGRNKLFAFLRQEKILMQNNQPYQEYIDRGYFRVIEQKFNKPDGDIAINLKTVIYQKGLDFVRKQIEEKWDGAE